MNTNEKLNAIYEKHKDNFPNSFFHSMLWKLMIDKVREGTKSALTPIIKCCHSEIGIADKDRVGYTPTGVVFETHNHNEQVKICDELNREIFGLDENESLDIILSSMRHR